MKTIKRNFAMILWLAAVLSVGAQTHLRYSLADCVQRAEQCNVSVRLAKVKVKQQGVRYDRVKHQRLPRFNANLSLNGSHGRATAGANQQGENLWMGQMNTALSGQLPLWLGGKIKHEKRQAKIEGLGAEEHLREVMEDLSLQVAQAYYTVLFRADLVTIAQQKWQQSAVQLKRVKGNYEVGKAAKVDVSEVENMCMSDELEWVQRKNDYALALLDLSQLLELDMPDSLQLVRPDTVRLDELGEEGPQQIFKMALLQNPKIKGGQWSVEAAAEGVKLAKTGYLPSLSLQVGMGASYNKMQGVSRGSWATQLSDNFNQSLGITLTIPIFNALDTRHAVQQARLEQDSRSLLLDEQKKMLYKQIQQAWYNAVGAREKCRTARKAEGVAKESFRLMTKKYEYGKANITEYNEQKTKWANAQIKAATAIYDYMLRLKIIGYYRGEPVA